MNVKHITKGLPRQIRKLKNLILKSWKDYLWIIIGSILVAVPINFFLVPYKIAPGGVSGIGTLLFYLSNGRIPIGVTIVVFNIPLFILGFRSIGGGFAIRSLFSTLFLSASIDFSAPYLHYVSETYLLKLNQGGLTSPDLLLYAIFGGAMMGLGVGLVLRSGATTGGSDLAAKIINHSLPHLPIGQILLIIEALILVAVIFTFKSFLLALYALITLFLQSKVIDWIMEGIHFAKAVYIISDQSDQIAKIIMKDLGRGVTALKGIGMYTGSDKRILLCILQRNELPILKRIVHAIDKDAFIILYDVREVVGEGF